MRSFLSLYVAMATFLAYFPSSLSFSTPQHQNGLGKHSVNRFNTPMISFTMSRNYDKRLLPSLLESFDEESQTGIFDQSSPLERPLLATLDFLSILTFAAIGKSNHSTDGSLDIFGVIITALPFILAWFSTSPITGIYSSDATINGPIQSVKAAAKGWVLAIPLGCILRGLIKGYFPPLPFIIVTLISTAVILGGARAIYSSAESKFS